jgi:hypothetical protein
MNPSRRHDSARTDKESTKLHSREDISMNPMASSSVALGDRIANEQSHMSHSDSLDLEASLNEVRFLRFN